jgi:uncharacterized RDD family membrane protein YckC
LIERIENPDSFVPEAVVAAYEEIKNRELQDIDYSTVESFLSRLEEKKRKEEEHRKEQKLKEKRTAKIDSERIQEREFASFGSRLIAFLLDIVFSIVIDMVIMLFVSPLVRIVGVIGEEAVIFVNNIMFLIITWIYFSVLEATDSQATYGKKILKIKVVKIDGGKLDFSKATFRFLLKIVSGLILGIGFFKAIFSPTNQTLHDKIIGTYVIKNK